MDALWTVTDAQERETMTTGGRFVKGFDVHFTEHSTGSEATVFVPESDFMAERTAQYVQPRANAIASTIGLSNAG